MYIHTYIAFNLTSNIIRLLMGGGRTQAKGSRTRHAGFRMLWMSIFGLKIWDADCSASGLVVVRTIVVLASYSQLQDRCTRAAAVGGSTSLFNTASCRLCRFGIMKAPQTTLLLLMSMTRQNHFSAEVLAGEVARLICPAVRWSRPSNLGRILSLRRLWPAVTLMLRGGCCPTRPRRSCVNRMSLPFPGPLFGNLLHLSRYLGLRFRV